MEFTSRCPSIINRKQLRECVSLLDQEYITLPYHIYIYKNRQELERERNETPNMLDESYKTILENKAAVPIGICLDDIKMIKIFPFNLDDTESDAIKCKVIWNVFHEIRHAWQYSKNMYTEEALILSPENIKDYYDQNSERDANLFADEFYKNKVSELLKILEINRGILIQSKVL
ncbi:hypothetical protein ACFSTH_11840 [Paenibacillus yanchengensis]|uniref:DUF3920 family protein n=1 Tax=Paenibacillus yanchengensis TaxID=2035833 RepID=A0ABW4YJH0_9BACL